MNSAVITALQISGIGLAGVFLFMAIFYFVIIGIDKLFPIEGEAKKSSTPTSSPTHAADEGEWQ